MSKPGFSTYVTERFSGFGGRAELQSDDVAPFPELAMRLFATDAMAHVVFSNCEGPVELVDRDSIHRDIANFKAALGDDAGDHAFMGSISPGQIAFNYPNHRYASHEDYLAALVDALSYEYRAIVDAGLRLQIDSPDRAWRGTPAPSGQHLCWGNYAGPHHCDVPFADIVGEVLEAKVGTIYPEGGNPRHEHEWRVFGDVALPDGMNVILGVIETKTIDQLHRTSPGRRRPAGARRQPDRARPPDGGHRLRL
jgi:5-methyltetrahydropteroyltriglutamate--homocysteine methyltransferase